MTNTTLLIIGFLLSLVEIRAAVLAELSWVMTRPKRDRSAYTGGALIDHASSAPEGQDNVTEERITRVTLAQARKMKSLTHWNWVRSMTMRRIRPKRLGGSR